MRLQAGAVAGQIEGVVGSLGLLYTTFAQGQDSIMVPNNVVLSAAVVPLREPAAVDLRARLRPDVRPSAVQSLLEDAVQTPVRGEPRIALEELDSDEVVVRVTATPVEDRDGPRLADEILAGPRRASPARSRTSGPVRGARPLDRDAARPAGRYARLSAGRAPCVGDLRAAEPALEPRGELGREPGERRARAQRRAARRRSPRGRARSRRTTAAATSSGVLVPTNARQLDAGVVEHARCRG